MGLFVRSKVGQSRQPSSSTDREAMVNGSSQLGDQRCVLWTCLCRYLSNDSCIRRVFLYNCSLQTLISSEQTNDLLCPLRTTSIYVEASDTQTYHHSLVEDDIYATYRTKKKQYDTRYIVDKYCSPFLSFNIYIHILIPIYTYTYIPRHTHTHKLFEQIV